MLEKLHIYITIIAALIVNICCIVMSNSLYQSVLYIIATIVVFYIIGIFVRNFIINNFYPEIDEIDEEADENLVEEAEGVEVSDEEKEQEQIG